jgi:hypothetical protein
MIYAVIYLRPAGALPAQQQRACLDYCERHGYQVHALAHAVEGAARAVESGTVEVVVSAHGGDDLVLSRRVHAAGGRLEYVRPPRRRVSLDPTELIVGMHERGADVDTIAHLLDTRAEDVRGALRQPRARRIR